MLPVYVDLMAADEDAGPGVTLGSRPTRLACGPCGEDFTGLLAALTNG